MSALAFVIGTVAGALLLSLFAHDGDTLATLRALIVERHTLHQRVADAERAAEAYHAQLLVLTHERDGYVELLEAKLCAAFNDGWMARDVAGVAQ